MKKITFLLLLVSGFLSAQTVSVDVSELSDVATVEIVANFGGPFNLFPATDAGAGLWTFDVGGSMDASNEYVWRVNFGAGGNQQEAMASKIGGSGVDNDVAIGQAFVTDFFSYCNRVVTIGGANPPTFYFNSFRQPGVTYPEIVLNAPTGDKYYIFYDANGFDAFGGPGAVDNGDGTHTALVRPAVAFEYKWVIDDTGGNANTDTQEDLLACTDDDVQINTDNATFANRIHAAGADDNDTFNMCPPPLSVDEFNIINVSVFPNPSQVNWNIKTNNQNITAVQIYNILGKNVMSLTPNSSSVELDASALPSGVYFARISTESGSKSMKLIKQ